MKLTGGHRSWTAPPFRRRATTVLEIRPLLRHNTHGVQPTGVRKAKVHPDVHHTAGSVSRTWPVAFILRTAVTSQHKSLNGRIVRQRIENSQHFTIVNTRFHGTKSRMNEPVTATVAHTYVAPSIHPNPLLNYYLPTTNSHLDLRKQKNVLASLVRPPNLQEKRQF